MENFNDYMDVLDFSPFIDFVFKSGKIVHIKKKDFFGLQGEPANYVGYIKEGAVRYICTDEEGNEHIVGYSFEHDFACDFTAFMRHAPRLVNIQAIQDTTLHVVTYSQMMEMVSATPQNRDLYIAMVEEYSITMYKRLLSFYCDTPERRYKRLLERCPNLLKIITLKEIASFIGVTPETVSHIRSRLKKENHSVTDR